MLGPGDTVPEFTLKTAGGKPFTQDELAGKRSILCFFPLAFSPVCADQLSTYEEVIDEFTRHDVQLYGISVDSSWCLKAFAEQLRLSIPLLSDFHPTGEVARMFGVMRDDAGASSRAIFIVEPDLTVSWSYVSPSPGEIPGANLIFDALAELSTA